MFFTNCTEDVFNEIKKYLENECQKKKQTTFQIIGAGLASLLTKSNHIFQTELEELQSINFLTLRSILKFISQGSLLSPYHKCDF